MKKWHEYIPHPIVMLFGILVLASILTYIIPAGEYLRLEIDGKMNAVPGSYHLVDKSPVDIVKMFFAFPQGFKTAVDIVFIILSSGIMFGFLEASGAIENGIGTFVHLLGDKNKNLLVVTMTFLYGGLGVFMGYENNIAMIPIAALLSLAIGGDLILAAGIAVGGVTIGFGLSPFNAYTIGTAHKIAQLPLFSGAGLRSVLCFIGIAALAWHNVRYLNKLKTQPENSLGIGLETKGLELSKPLSEYSMSAKDIFTLMLFVVMMGMMLIGVFRWHWYLNEISGLFLILAFVLALISRKNTDKVGNIVLDSVAKVAPGAFMVGFASTIKVVLEMGKINDTIAHHLSEILVGLPSYLSAVGMVFTQSLMNFVIPSGSGQALATLPVLLPVGEVLGLTKQTVVLAFQVGDGLTNLVNPALGGLVAMIAICRVPFDRWVRFILPLMLILIGISLIFVVISVFIHYGPS
jgi:uncharacterized ion transporter superfamily protein YfcC